MKCYTIKEVAEMLQVKKKDIKLVLFNMGDITWSWAVTDLAQCVVELNEVADGGGIWTTPLVLETGVRHLRGVFEQTWHIISDNEYAEEIVKGRWEVES